MSIILLSHADNCCVISVLMNPSGAVCPVADALHWHRAALLHWPQSSRVATETVHAIDKRRWAGHREQRTGSTTSELVMLQFGNNISHILDLTSVTAVCHMFLSLRAFWVEQKRTSPPGRALGRRSACLFPICGPGATSFFSCWSSSVWHCWELRERLTSLCPFTTRILVRAKSFYPANVHLF